MSTIASLAVQLTADPTGALKGFAAFASALNRTSGAMGAANSWATAARGAGNAIVSALQNPLGALESMAQKIPYVGQALALLPAAAGTGITKLTQWFKEGSSSIMNMYTAAQRLNTTTEDIAPIMLLAGDSAESAARGMFHMQRTIAEAAAGSDEAQRKLGHLGLTAEELSGLSIGDQFAKVADRINATGNSSERATKSFDIFSKSASEINRVLKRGSKGIEEFRQKMAANGMGFSSAEAEQVRQANIALKSLDRTMTAFKQNIAIALAPIINELSASMTTLGVTAHDTQDHILGAARAMTIFAVAGADLAAGAGPLGALDSIQKINALFDRIQERLEQARKAKPPENGPGAGQFLLAEQAEALTSKLNNQVLAYGRNSAAVEINALKQKGATDEMLAAARARAAELETLDKINSTATMGLSIFNDARAKIAQLNIAFAAGQITAEGLAGGLQKVNDALEKSAASKAAEVYKATQNPLEQFATKIEELGELLDAGSISWETYERAVSMAGKSLTDLNKAQDKLAGGAAAFGSQEAFASIDKATSGAGPGSGLDSLKDAIKAQHEEQKRQRRDLDDIARAARAGFLTVGRI